MPDHPNSEKKKSLQSSDDIQVPPIPKQTAGALTGAAIGSIAGPAGAVVGGVIGAVVGKAAADGPVRKATRRATAVSKGALKRHPVKKSLTKSRKGGGRRLRAKGAKRTGSRKSSAAKSHARRSRQSTSSRAGQRRSSGRKTFERSSHLLALALLPRRSVMEQFARWLRCRCSETSFSSRLTTIAEAALQAAASSLATLFVAWHFFPTEKKVRYAIRANYGVGDEVFLRTTVTWLRSGVIGTDQKGQYHVGILRQCMPLRSEAT